MIIGTSRISIGRLGIRSGNANTLELLSNASIFERYTASLLSNANVVDIILVYLESNADIDEYNRRQVLSNASIIGIEVPEILSNASIAELIALGLSSNASVVVTALVSVLSNAAILGQETPSVLSNASICGPFTKELSSNASIAALIALGQLSNASIADLIALDMDSNANIASIRQSTISSNAYVVDLRYWAIGPEGSLINLSGMVADPDPHGFGVDASHQQIPGGRRTILQDNGIDGGKYSFSVYLANDNNRQAFQMIANNDAEDLRLFAGRSDRFYQVKKISLEPLKDKRYAGPAAKVTCLMEDPYLYHAVDLGVDIGACSLPQDDTSKYNYGSVAAPLLFRIGGQYSSGQLTLPYVKCIDGAAEETSLYLGPGLLSNEYAELTLEGSQKYYLRHTYADDFSTNNYWQYDAVQSGCTLSGGQVSVPAGAWFYYKFQGQPLKDDIALEATITTSTSPIIQYSTDGSTWYTAVAATEISSGVKKTYYLTGTEKKSTVYVRFYSPTGSSMTVQDVSVSMDRDISAQYDQIPMIPPGETRVMRVTGSGSAKAKIRSTFRSRWYAQ